MILALHQAAAQCQRTIEDFWNKIKTYHPALSLKGTTSWVKEGWMKIQWAVYKKEDIDVFKADIAAHTDSIQLLLTTIQMSHANLHEKRNERRNLSLAGKIQTAYFECMKKISAIFEITATGIEQGKQLISTSSKILETNVKIFQVVLNLQNFITHIPTQVERQQPVYLVDAFGRHSPFHLEFIRSAEALTAVLEANFSKNSQARKKIGRGEFIIQNSLTKHDINIFGDWDKCFYPGQRVEMSVVFQRRWQTGSSCPGCGVVCDGSTETEVECPNCEMTFRRIIEIEQERSTGVSSHQEYRKPVLYRDASLVAKERDRSISILQTTSKIYPNSGQQQDIRTAPKLKRKREYAHDDDLELDLHLENIRRVRITTVARGITEKFRALFGYFEEGGTPEPAFCCGFRTKDDESCLIIEFEDNGSSALCDTIGSQTFKLGGLFHTDLVAAEAINKDAEETSTQITWMEEDEVQMYLRFESSSDRNIIWAFILFAQAVWKMRAGQPLSNPSTQAYAAKATSLESDVEDSLKMHSDSPDGKGDDSFAGSHFQGIDHVVLASPSSNGRAFQMTPKVDNLNPGYTESFLTPYEGLPVSVFGQEPFEGIWQPLFSQDEALSAIASSHAQPDEGWSQTLNKNPASEELISDDELYGETVSPQFTKSNFSNVQDPEENNTSRNHNGKASADPALYACYFKPCPYRSKRQLNCKQHMEKAHGWEYVRSKNNGKNYEKDSVSSGHAIQANNTPVPSSDANTAHNVEEYDYSIHPGNNGPVIEELPPYSRPRAPVIVQDPNDTAEMKRARNTLAARRSRNRLTKRFSKLEGQISELEQERDHWKAGSSGSQKSIPENTPREDIALSMFDVDMKLVFPDEDPNFREESNAHNSAMITEP